MKISVSHFQRLKDSLVEEFAKAHSGQYFHQIALYVNRDTVFPAATGLVLQRNLSECRDKLGIGHVRIEKPCLNVGSVYCRLSKNAIGQAPGMIHQLPDGHWMIGRLSNHVAFIVGTCVNLKILHLGQVFLYRV